MMFPSHQHLAWGHNYNWVIPILTSIWTTYIISTVNYSLNAGLLRIALEDSLLNYCKCPIGNVMSGRVANTCQQTPSTEAENGIANGLVPAKGKQGKLQLKKCRNANPGFVVGGADELWIVSNAEIYHIIEIDSKSTSPESQRFLPDRS